MELTTQSRRQRKIHLRYICMYTDDWGRRRHYMHTNYPGWRSREWLFEPCPVLLIRIYIYILPSTGGNGEETFIFCERGAEWRRRLSRDVINFNAFSQIYSKNMRTSLCTPLACSPACQSKPLLSVKFLFLPIATVVISLVVVMLVTSLSLKYLS